MSKLHVCHTIWKHSRNSLNQTTWIYSTEGCQLALKLPFLISWLGIHIWEEPSPKPSCLRWYQMIKLPVSNDIRSLLVHSNMQNRRGNCKESQHTAEVQNWNLKNNLLNIRPSKITLSSNMQFYTQYPTVSPAEHSKIYF